jgi:hypothetical protein
MNGRVLVGALSLAAIGAVGLVWSYWQRGVTVVVRNSDSSLPDR